MARVLPHADLFALTLDDTSALDFGGRTVTTTVLDRAPILRQRRDLQLPLMPLAWRYASRRSYDIVVTSTHACAKGFRPGRAGLHLSYCYTPLRYVWEPSVDLRRQRNPLATAAARTLRVWDRRSAHWVDEFAAISTAVAVRVERFYQRSAKVIHPPVDTCFFTPSSAGRRLDVALAVSRMIPYKRLDLAIEACSRVGLPLVVAGSGGDERRLRELALRLGTNVQFVIAPDDAALRDLYRSARVLVFPADEDFGIVSVEAQACGTPVVALGRGGSTDTVLPDRTGVLASEQTVEAFAEGIERALSRDFRPDDCRGNAERFSEARFRDAFRGWVIESATRHGLDASELVGPT